MSENVSVPKATALLLNEALLRAVQNSLQMRQALEIFERAAKNNEALIERVQNVLSQILPD